jgi:cell division protein FtsQ
MIPKLGNQVIVFGDAEDAAEKFSKLKLFYKKVITTTGWNRYSVINLQYKNQVVAKIKGAEDKSADSLRTLQIMQLIADRAAKQAADSVQTFIQDSEKNTTDSSMIQQSMERDEPESGTTTEVVTEESSRGNNALSNGAAIVKPVAIKPATTVNKPAVKPVAKPAAEKPKPVAKPPAKPAAKPTGNKPAPRAVMKKA